MFKNLLTLLLFMPFAAVAIGSDIVIPPIAECIVQDSAGLEFRAGANFDNSFTCEMFSEQGRDACDKVVPAVNQAMAECQKKGTIPCRAVRCWENPQ